MARRKNVMQEKEEKELIDKLLAPKTQHTAFRELVDQYSRLLYWQIRKIVISHHDTDDILQNVFIKVWQNLNHFRNEAKLSTWLYRIAVNESITFLNRERAKHNVSIDDADVFLIAQLESDPYFDGNTADIELQKAVLKLPEKQRIVFNMKYFDEMKYSEISEILETSEGALKASYHHAVKKIEEYLSKDD